jgi:hypothetical protein
MYSNLPQIKVNPYKNTNLQRIGLDNVKMLVEDKKCEDMDWTNLAQDRGNCIFY